VSNKNKSLTSAFYGQLLSNKFLRYGEWFNVGQQ
jgi:hypothetical protein